MDRPLQRPVSRWFRRFDSGELPEGVGTPPHSGALPSSTRDRWWGDKIGRPRLFCRLGFAIGPPYVVAVAKIFLVDDELTMVQMVAEVLQADGHEVFPFTSVNGVAEALTLHQPDLVITDLYLDRKSAQGLEIVRKARALSPPPAIIMITGFGTVESAVEAMKAGAFDYLEKPFKLEELKLCVHRALTHTEMVAENRQLRKELKKQYRFTQIVGTSPPMQEVFRMVELVADTDATVLILGESGTGKELIARSLHYNSRRAQAPFIPINCSALPENLLESELFGHRKGAFTGAINDKLGLFQEADGGTLFLDEIGTMPAALQSRLLRVLQEKEVRRVGDNSATLVNVRILSATNENLESLVKNGRFREDLYYRLNVIAIHLPSLKERLEDIPLLAAHFLKDKFHAKTNQRFQLSRRTMETLCAYQWPGNVREFENAIQRATVLAALPLIRTRDLPPAIQAFAAPDVGSEEVPESFLPPTATHPPETAVTAPTGEVIPAPIPMAAGNLKDFIRTQEQKYIEHVLRAHGGDKEETARILEISLATLYRKLSESSE